MIAVCECSKQTTSCGELPKVINTDHHQKPACAGCIGLRSRPRPHAVVEHSKSRRPQLPRVGAVSLDTDAKKSLHGRGWRFQCREAGDYVSNLAVRRRAVWSIGDSSANNASLGAGRFFWIGDCSPNHSLLAAACHARLHSTANCEPRCARCNR
jgi:hypothetical protein